MAHGHDDAHGGSAGHGEDAHGPGPGDAHGDAHGGHAASEAPPAPPTPQVLAIARVTRWLGLLVWGGAFVAAWPLLFRHGWACFGWAAFASLYGFCVWLAARDTLSREAALPPA